MSYVYLIKPIPETADIQVNDVGVIQGDGQLPGTTQVKFLHSNLTVDLSPDKFDKFNIFETGDRFDYKVCDRCFKRLPTDRMFQDNRIKKDNIITKRPSCKDCRKIKDGIPVSVTDRITWLAKRPENFTDFTCPICQKTTIVGITKIVLDHNHHDGRVRGWLCESCNTGIGRFDDDPELIVRALHWLEND